MIVVKGKVISVEERSFTYVKNGKQEKGLNRTAWIVGNGRPIEVRLRLDTKLERGKDVEVPVFVTVFTLKNGGAGFRLVEQEMK
jgi:hypothetical protein